MENSITELKEHIYFNKTKEYFYEVEKSFYSENYRSAVVMLYSIVIADLLYKLEELKDYYSDKVAEEILSKINKKREEEPQSPEWEKTLLEEISKKTSILEPYVKINIEHLKSVRNFSAHPSLNQNNELIEPSREKTLGLMKDMLIGIFIRPPLFIKKITENLSEDIATKREVFLLDNEKFSQYINKKYFNKTPDNMIVNVFRDFWKFTFKIDNNDCNNNRDINLQFLIVTMQYYKINILKDMQIEGSIYNNISDNENIAIYLIEFMYYFPETYYYLKEENKINIDVVMGKRKEYRAIAYYTSNNIEQHINKLSIANLSSKHTRQLLERKVKEEGMESILLDKYIELVGNSESYNSADKGFDELIRPNIEKMSSKQIINLIENINTNNQLYDRWRAKDDNNDIIKKAVSMDWDSFQFNQYRNFKYDEMVVIESQLPF